jgi:hypothetical protein
VVSPEELSVVFSESAGERRRDRRGAREPSVAVEDDAFDLSMVRDELPDLLGV